MNELDGAEEQDGAGDRHQESGFVQELDVVVVVGVGLLVLFVARDNAGDGRGGGLFEVEALVDVGRLGFAQDEATIPSRGRLHDEKVT